MAKKKAEKSATAPIPAPVPAAPKAGPSLESRVTELEGDLLRLAKLCGNIWGEPLASQALEIASKRQGA